MSNLLNNMPASNSMLALRLAGGGVSFNMAELPPSTFSFDFLSFLLFALESLLLPSLLLLLLFLLFPSDLDLLEDLDFLEESLL